MRLYHLTWASAAASILRNGFRDGAGTYMTDRPLTGVWVSEVPFDINDGARGDTLLEVDLDLDQALINGYEAKEEGKTRREWLIPSALLNAHASVKLATEEETSVADDYSDRLEHLYQASVAAVDEMKGMIAGGDDVPMTAFLEWETRTRALNDELLATYQATGDAAGIARVKVLQAQIDKAVRIATGKQDDA